MEQKKVSDRKKTSLSLSESLMQKAKDRLAWGEPLNDLVERGLRLALSEGGIQADTPAPPEQPRGSPEIQSALYSKARLAVEMLQDVLEEWANAQARSDTAGADERVTGKGSDSATGDPGHQRRDLKKKAN